MLMVDPEKLHLKLLDMEFPIQDQDTILDAIYECMVDAVRIVRCEDCKHYSLCGRPPFMYFQCTRRGVTVSVKEDDFCNYGEAKDENLDNVKKEG